ncbi:DNA/RNA-binding protein Alba-like [Cinara cedri]|uniref:DNA/RNA-binding protein Alba-like n=1 Tax=Cinara cedri TaxID=506608 RepID=A0A5E4NGZ6_9HEMI|nr:DNA/RNA-binding protein Alba-like [Cinara cedri]
MSSLAASSETALVKEVFVSLKTPLKCHISRAVKHLELDNSILILNGLGKAIKNTIEIALQLQEKFQDTIIFDIQTSTAEIKDILEPLNEDDDYEGRTRSLSSIHIKISK